MSSPVLDVLMVLGIFGLVVLAYELLLKPLLAKPTPMLPQKAPKITDREYTLQALSTEGILIDRTIDVSKHQELFIDDSSERIVVRTKHDYKIYNYRDIISFELCENGRTVIEGRAGTSLVGGFLFGATGAIAGAAASKQSTDLCTSLILRIYINNPIDPIVNLVFLDLVGVNILVVPKNSKGYMDLIESAQDVIGVLKYIQEKTRKTNAKGKICPMCAEEVKAEAKLCRFCGFLFEPLQTIQEHASIPQRVHNELENISPTMFDKSSV